MTQRRPFAATLALTVAGFTLACTAPAEAELVSYYVGVDDLSTIATGTYAGLPNPNYNRLTMLYAHSYPDTPASNHYHSKGIKTYTGPNLGASTAVVTSASDYVPEGSLEPVRLSSGSGLYAGKLVSNPYTDTSDPSYHFSFFTLKSTESLAGFAAGTGENYMFNASSGRWDSPLQSADLHLQLVSLTPGLNVGSWTSTTIGLSTPGSELHLGSPNASFSFTPTFWTDASAAPGIYEAKFRFTDEEGFYEDSGDFRFRLQVVPEPDAIGLLSLGSIFAIARRRRALPVQ